MIFRRAAICSNVKGLKSSSHQLKTQAMVHSSHWCSISIFRSSFNQQKKLLWYQWLMSGRFGQLPKFWNDLCESKMLSLFHCCEKSKLSVFVGRRGVVYSTMSQSMMLVVWLVERGRWWIRRGRYFCLLCFPIENAQIQLLKITLYWGRHPRLEHLFTPHTKPVETVRFLDFALDDLYNIRISTT